MKLGLDDRVKAAVHKAKGKGSREDPNMHESYVCHHMQNEF